MVNLSWSECNWSCSRWTTPTTLRRRVQRMRGARPRQSLAEGNVFVVYHCSRIIVVVYHKVMLLLFTALKY